METVKLTSKQWHNTHSDFKATFDGKPFVLQDCGGRGTCFVPVEIVPFPVKA